MLSRIHSKQIKVKDFVRVIEGFNVIYSLIHDLSKHDLAGLLKSIFESLPDLEAPLAAWATNFDHGRAKNEGVLIPEKGVGAEFDQSLETISGVEQELQDKLRAYKKELKTVDLIFKDSGKEIYLIEVPSKAYKNVPSDWEQVDATAKCKRYYSPETKKLVRKLLEAQELHKQVVDPAPAHALVFRGLVRLKLPSHLWWLENVVCYGRLVSRLK